MLVGEGVVVVCGDRDLMLCVQIERATHGVALGGCLEVCEKVLDLKKLYLELLTSKS